MKKYVSILLALAMVLSSVSAVFAVEESSFEEQNPIEMASAQVNAINPGNPDQPNGVVTGYRKANVTTSYAWGGYSRVSDTLVTNAGGGKITCNVSKTYKTEVSGNISGLGINTSGTYTTSTSYQLPVKANSKAYMQHRVKYKVEKGTRQLYNIANGNVISSNSYTVKVPISGEYSLKYL